MTDLIALSADLRAEGDELDALVAGLDDQSWRTPTPAEGWTVAHQVSHLAWTDRLSVLSIRDPQQFTAELGDALADPTGFVEAGAAEGAVEDPAELLRRWRRGRSELTAALALADPDTKLPWFGPPMKPLSMATARIMETWAHGQDVVDALGATRRPTARLRHIAHLGVRTRGFAFQANGMSAPEDPVRVELTGPEGAVWSWGPEDAEQRVTGSALDFCLLVTQRRHLDDLDVTATGEVARTWLGIAQAFAGPPGGGRTAGQFS
ncbi:TIGR03084 family metal-binding protein [Allokutzneria albata]|uniref:TIGR03084 family protein n=1 Tax=Allokutzneria albata TaxID=211114 RepID=A0A1H0DHL8_ALLAB|nr:TIGR03084 family metal-binding protein [Allokutzneria albata]SDN69584.1 TIGR03084 family protein [Allokutzneria albata]